MADDNVMKLNLSHKKETFAAWSDLILLVESLNEKQVQFVIADFLEN